MNSAAKSSQPELKLGTDQKTFSENLLTAFLAGKSVSEAQAMAFSMHAISNQVAR